MRVQRVVMPETEFGVVDETHPLPRPFAFGDAVNDLLALLDVAGPAPAVLVGQSCCPALKMTMTPSPSMKTKMVALVATLTG